MTQQMAPLLLIVFSIHLLIFIRLAFRHRRVHFFLAVISFLALVVSYALRLWRPQLNMAGHDLALWLRFTAWITTAGSAGLAIRNKLN
jgi:4-amino-4-deoxy-L-arabinose transferase-like glycosyltransferase